jgi:outer membrane protein OmpA-like peptidoglycan-associated protein
MLDYKNILLSILISIGGLVYGQQDLTLMNLDNIQQIQYVNPALRPQARLNIGLPGLSSLYFNHYNSVFTPKDLFDTDGGSTTLRVDHLKKMWKKKNDISFSGKFDLLHFGFAKGKNYFSFHITENTFSRVTLPGDLLRFPLTGNASAELENGTLDFSDFGIELNHYREYSFGFQREWNDKLSVGGKLKYLYGMENIHTKKSDFTLATDSETFDWTINGEFAANTSGIYSLTDSIENNTDLENEEYVQYATKRKNRGLGIDLGATYELTEKITVAASVVDLGFIRWKNDNKNIVSSDGSFAFTGVDFSNALFVPDSVRQDSIDAAIERVQGEAEEAFSVSDNTDAYTTSLLSRFYLSGSYKLYEGDKSSGKAGALIHGEFFRGRLRPSLTLSYTQKLGKMLQASASYSMTNRSFNNLGLGMSVNFGSFQFYIVTDNVFAARLANINSDGESTPYPYGAKNMHVRTGFNLTFGRKNKDKDDDGIKDKDDDCPEVAGLLIFNGCPDSDGDSIPDNRDLCPSQPGVPMFKGCPDTDLDGVKDSKDACPTEKGTVENLGCPDRDEDGIIDNDDVCPDVKGIEAFKGCPDTDGDGIQDSEDDCPEKIGSKDMNGCPDSDADNIPDPKDACPDEAGEVENNGCPWGDRDNDGVKDNVDKCPSTPGVRERDGCPLDDADSDGVPDGKDKCPNTPGPIENNGCPKIEKEEQEILNTAFDDLEFQSAKAIIKDASYPSLQALAELMKKKPTWKLKIAGHTDSDGSASANLKLSKSRAQAVANYLKAKGIEEKRFSVEGFGESQPIADNKTSEGKQKNRRVEMTIEFE